jgi:hypothetical protein
VLSFALLFITSPSVQECARALFVSSQEAHFAPQLVKYTLTSFLILSSVTRYYGAVKENIDYIIYSLTFLILGLQGVLRARIYEIFWIWLGEIHVSLIILIPFVLLILNLFFVARYERKWIMFYSNERPGTLTTDLFISLNLWAFLTIFVGIYSTLIVPLSRNMIYFISILSIGFSAFFTLRILPKIRTGDNSYSRHF